MTKKTKAFYIDKDIDKRFKKTCVDLEVNQGDVLELLVLRWLKLTDARKKRVELYTEKYEKE